MRSRGKWAIATVAAAGLVLSLFVGGAGSAWGARFNVSVSNETEGQPLSPGLVIVAKPEYRPFKVGRRTGRGLSKLATEGKPSLFAVGEQARRSVYKVFRTPLLKPGESFDRDFVVRRKEIGISYLAAVACTNDAFVGKTAQMTRNTGSTTTSVPVFDAYVEQNNENLRFISELCGNSPDKREEHTNLPAPESGVIAPHDGIMGDGDLDKNVMGWSSDGAALLRVARSKR